MLINWRLKKSTLYRTIIRQCVLYVFLRSNVFSGVDINVMKRGQHLLPTYFAKNLFLYPINGVVGLVDFFLRKQLKTILKGLK